jgi:LPXTG-motif cell wall-anchored protein
MLNKRKAFIGYVVYTLGKPIAKRAVKSKAKSATPGKRGGVIAGTIAGIGAVLGGLMFWRKRKKSEESLQS